MKVLKGPAFLIGLSMMFNMSLHAQTQQTPQKSTSENKTTQIKADIQSSNLGNSFEQKSANANQTEKTVLVTPQENDVNKIELLQGGKLRIELTNVPAAQKDSIVQKWKINEKPDFKYFLENSGKIEIHNAGNICISHKRNGGVGEVMKLSAIDEDENKVSVRGFFDEESVIKVLNNSYDLKGGLEQLKTDFAAFLDNGNNEIGSLMVFSKKSLRSSMLKGQSILYQELSKKLAHKDTASTSLEALNKMFDFCKIGPDVTPKATLEPKQ